MEVAPTYMLLLLGVCTTLVSSYEVCSSNPLFETYCKDGTHCCEVNKCCTNGLGKWEIVGITVGVVFVLLLIWAFCKARCSKNRQAHTNPPSNGVVVCHIIQDGSQQGGGGPHLAPPPIYVNSVAPHKRWNPAG